MSNTTKKFYVSKLQNPVTKCEFQAIFKKNPVARADPIPASIEWRDNIKVATMEADKQLIENQKSLKES